MLELTDLTTKKESYVEELSRGMKQRLCLAKTLVHDPQLLLLDEPASGLDPRARIEIKELLKELKNMNKTILISSHILPELADFCNKIGIIEQGELIVSGDVNEIMRQVSGGITLDIRVVPEDRPAAMAVLGKLACVRNPRQVDDDLKVDYLGDPDETYRVLNALVENGVRVRGFAEEQTDLEDIFMKVTRGVVS